MERDLAKRFVTKDGKQRIAIYYDEDADNPRYNTDEPLHCEDWSRNYSIMIKSERETKSPSARDLIICLALRYGDREKFVDKLVANGKLIGKDNVPFDNGLVYDKARHGWVLYEYGIHYDYETRKNKMDWYEVCFFECRKKYIDLEELLDYSCDFAIDYFAEFCMGDGVKIASYNFGYNAEVTFDDDFNINSDGIAWLEKDEFLKYSGCKEDYWKGKTLKEIEWLTDELEAWGDNEVYGFVVEDAVRVIINTRYPDGEHDDTETDEIEWKETESCYGFYGELDKRLEWMLDYAGFKKEELTEVA